MTKPTKWHIRPRKTLLNLDICPVWPESLLSAWRKLGFLATNWAHSKASGWSESSPGARHFVMLPASKKINETPHDKTNKMACAPSKDSDQPGHPPSLTRVFAVLLKKPWVLSYQLSGYPGWSEALLAHVILLCPQLQRAYCFGFVRLSFRPFVWLCASDNFWTVHDNLQNQPRPIWLLAGRSTFCYAPSHLPL